MGAASQKAATEKAAAEKAVAEKTAAEKVVAEKAAEEKAATEKAAAEKAATSMTTFVPGYIERDSSLENFEELEVVQELIKEGERTIPSENGKAEKDPITLIPVRKADYDKK